MHDIAIHYGEMLGYVALGLAMLPAYLIVLGYAACAIATGGGEGASRLLRRCWKNRVSHGFILLYLVVSVLAIPTFSYCGVAYDGYWHGQLSDALAEKNAEMQSFLGQEWEICQLTNNTLYIVDSDGNILQIPYLHASYTEAVPTNFKIDSTLEYPVASFTGQFHDYHIASTPSGVSFAKSIVVNDLNGYYLRVPYTYSNGFAYYNSPGGNYLSSVTITVPDRTIIPN